MVAEPERHLVDAARLTSSPNRQRLSARLIHYTLIVYFLGPTLDVLGGDFQR
jgi:hypothetical protein